MPVGVRANLSLALSQGELRRRPRLRARRCRASPTSRCATPRRSRVATFFSPDRLTTRRGGRCATSCSGGSTPCVATSEETAAAAAERFPGDYRVVSPGVDLELFRPGEKRRLIVVELHSALAARRAGGAAVAPRAARLGDRPAPHEAAVGAARRSRSACATACSVRSGASRLGPLGAARRGRDLRSRAHRLRPAAARGRRRRGRRGRAARRGGAARARRRRDRAPGRGRRAARAREARGRARRRSATSTTSPRELDEPLREPRQPPAPTPRREHEPARRPPLDRRRPAHAHVLVARLLDRGGRAARSRRGGGPGRDRRHRPQRLRRRARGRRAARETAS